MEKIYFKCKIYYYIDPVYDEDAHCTRYDIYNIEGGSGGYSFYSFNLEGLSPLDYIRKKGDYMYPIEEVSQEEYEKALEKNNKKSFSNYSHELGVAQGAWAEDYSCGGWDLD